MKIHGVEGMLPEDIRDEVNRGGRLVIYTYCVSVLIMTFKRPADIRLVKAGHNPAAAGWPYTVLSLLCGWWGFPWGPIYTVQCIYRNLCGGIDVTDEVLRQILPAGAAVQSSATHTQPLVTTPPAPARKFDLKIASYFFGAICAVVALGITIYCYQKKQTLTVVLASGLAETYRVTLNGQPHTLKPFATEVLELPEGDFELADAPGEQVVGGRQNFNFSLPFYAHLDNDRVAIINPDRCAILVNSEVPYYSSTSTPPADETPAHDVLSSELTYFIPKPDFVMVEPDSNISMPSGTARLVKTRLEIVRQPDLSVIVPGLNEKSGYPAARNYVMQVARRRTDEKLLVVAMQTLKPEDLRSFFQLHLADRPVLVDWHRYYQQQMTDHQPELDLSMEYRTYLQAEPGNGALAYLLGRQVKDYEEQSKLWRAALTANPPCHYADAAMGFDALSEGHFAEAEAHYLASAQAGISTLSLTYYHHQALFALGRNQDILTELAVARKAEPQDLALAAEEIRNTYALAHDKASAMKLKENYLSAYKATKPSAKNLSDAGSFLQTEIDYFSGDLANYAQLVSHFDSPFYNFRAAITTSQLDAAVKNMTTPDVEGELLLFLLAQHNGSVPAAELHFKAAHEAMKRKDWEFRQVAAQLDTENPDAPLICGLRMNVESKRILLTALGVHRPADQNTYFDLARKLNFDPGFPHQFLQQFLVQ